MSSRTFLLVAMVLVALLIACNKEGGEIGGKPQALVPDTTIADLDTTPADRYFSQAEQFAESAQYDSALVYYEKAGALYEAAEAWEEYARCYIKMGIQALRNRALDRATDLLNHAVEVGRVRLGEEHPVVAESYHNMGIVSRRQGNPDQALEYNNKALAIRLATLGEQHPDVARSYINMGNIYTYHRGIDLALEHYEKALAALQATPGEYPFLESTAYNGRGVAYYESGDYDKALDSYINAAAIRRASLGDQDPYLANTYNNIGNIYTEKGDYDKAVEFQMKALGIRRAVFEEPHLAFALSYQNLGGIYLDKGDYGQALDYYNKAVAFHAAWSGEQSSGVAHNYNNIGIIYREKGEYDKALDVYQKALAILTTSSEQQHEVADIYDNMGNVYLDEGRYDEALKLQQKALMIRFATQGEQHPNVARSHNNIGKTYQRQGDYDRALAHHEKSLAIRLARLGKHHPLVASSYNDLGRVYHMKGDYDRALGFYEQALQANRAALINHAPYTKLDLDRVLSENYLLESLSSKAQALAARAATRSNHVPDLEAATETYRLAVQLIDQMRHGYKAEGSKLILAENATEIYDKAVQTVLQLYRATREDQLKETAFHFSEKNKAGILLDALGEARAKRFAGISDTLLQHEHQLRIDLTGYETVLAQERDKPIAERDSARMVLWQDKLFDLRQQYQTLLQQFENDYPDYYNLKYQTRTASVEEIQVQLLNENTALVSYFTGQDSLFIFTLTHDRFNVTSIARDSLLEQQVEQLRRGIVERDYARYTTYAYPLYQQLIEPVRDQLTAKHLIVVPDDVLNYVPFETLLTHPVNQDDHPKDYRTLPYLLNDYTVSYAYSATLLLQTQQRQRPTPERDFLAFAPVFPDSPGAGLRSQAFADSLTLLDSAWVTRAGNRILALPGTRDEVQNIADLFRARYGLFERLFGKRVKVYLEDEAREVRVKADEMARYRYVHLATHGFFSEQAPELSRLLLIPEDTTATEDGVLNLGEVYNLRLNADLVVLSACETGLGRLAQGEGLIGLTRGFLYAGAENVIVSLWQVPDVRTGEVMVDFYGALLAGQPRASALRSAKLGLVQGRPEYALPYYWAPFILVGQ